MKLFFKDTMLGEIDKLGVDGFEFYGEIKFSKNYDCFREFFQHITDEKSFDDGTEKKKEFPNDYFNDDNWSIEEDGTKRNIFFPAIHENDNSIYWRWRD